MSKKVRRKKQLPAPRAQGWNKRKAVLAIVLVLSMVGIVIAQWRSIRRVSTHLSLPPQTSQTPQLSKEYIYAGGRLVATEEPNIGGGTSPLSAPSSLIATGMTTPGTQINLTWTASTGGAVAQYQVERMHNLASGYTVVASNVTSPSYTDTQVIAGTAYLYRVRAMDTSNNFSSYSSFDLAVAISFTEDPLVSYSENQSSATPIRATHITQLRDAVNAVRVLANIPAATWTNNVQTGAAIYALDVTELRSKLQEALTALSLPAPSYTYPTLTQYSSLIHKADIQELRNAVK